MSNKKTKRKYNKKNKVFWNKKKNGSNGKSKALTLVKGNIGSNKIDKSNDKFVKAIESSGLREEWKSFIGEYLNNGFNATKAYRVAYPDCTNDNSASAAGSRLLSNVNIKKEIYYRVDAQGATNDGIISELWEIARLRGVGELPSAVKALELLANSKGLIKAGDSGAQFFANNIAVFQPVVDVKESKNFENLIKGGGKIIE